MIQIKKKFLSLVLAFVIFLLVPCVAQARHNEGIWPDVVDQKSVIDEQIQTVSSVLPVAGAGAILNPSVELPEEKPQQFVSTIQEESLAAKEAMKNPYIETIETLTEEEKIMICQITWCESGNQCTEGQRAVMEVILNRLQSDIWPNTIEEVLSAPRQFTTWRIRHKVTQEQIDQMYNILNLVYSSENIVLPDNEYVYFNNSPHHNSYNIQGHWFWK